MTITPKFEPETRVWFLFNGRVYDGYITQVFGTFNLRANVQVVNTYYRVNTLKGDLAESELFTSRQELLESL